MKKLLRPEPVGESGQVDQWLVFDTDDEAVPVATLKRLALLRLVAREMNQVAQPRAGESEHVYKLADEGGETVDLNFACGRYLYSAQAWIEWAAAAQANNLSTLFTQLDALLERRGYRIVQRPGYLFAPLDTPLANVVCHWTADGVPACRLEPSLQEFARLHPAVVATRSWAEDFLAITVCAHTSRAAAQSSIDALLKYLPDAQCEVVNGQCPVYLQRQSKREDGRAVDVAHSTAPLVDVNKS